MRYRLYARRKTTSFFREGLRCLVMGGGAGLLGWTAALSPTSGKGFPVEVSERIDAVIDVSVSSSSSVSSELGLLLSPLLPWTAGFRECRVAGSCKESKDGEEGSASPLRPGG